MSSPGRRLEVSVQRLAPEGEGLCRSAGDAKLVFVPYAAPGDRLEVELTSEKGTFARARPLRLLAPGPDRVEPACSVHFAFGRPGPACGGCDWQHLSYPAQLRHKAELARDCLRRLARLGDARVAETLPSPQPWGYRNKVQVPFGLAKDRRLVAGFYAAGSREIVPFEACPVQPELSVRIALKIKELASRWGWPPYDDKAGRGWLRHAFVRTNSAGKALAALVTRVPDLPKREEFVSEMRAAFPELAGLHQNVQPLKTSVILGPDWRRLWGADSLEERIGPLSFLVSPGAFLQVNTGAAEVLYDEALKALRADGKSFELVLDLYSGVGTLALWLARSCRRVIGVEESREAVKDAWRNAERNGIKTARFQAGRVESALPRLRGELPTPSAAVVDPPRAGLSQPVLRLLTSPALKRVVYVSCNPATFARDAGYLTHAGYALRGVQPVDLFPQTSHVELVGLFDR